MTAEPAGWPVTGVSGVTEQPDRVIVLGARGCHLCEVAHEVVTRVCQQRGETWRAVDLDDAPPAQLEQARARYAERIPVVFVDGVEHAQWRVDPAALQAALRRRRRSRIRDFVHSFTKS